MICVMIMKQPGWYGSDPLPLMEIFILFLNPSLIINVQYMRILNDWYLQLGLVLADTWAGSSPSPTQCRQLNTSSGSHVLLTASSLEYWSSVQNLDTVILSLHVFYHPVFTDLYFHESPSRLYSDSL